ncbi:hypothetical protein HQ571_03730 [Candidatus Kuenenbacteria bacterium]|nr:hypothetical protein [Candidatus Kuenenbacteria bacterium]
MRKLKKKLIEYLIVLFIIVVIIISAGTVLYFKSFAQDDFKLGVNFSKSYAQYLGLNWQDTYFAILDDLNVKDVRVAAPWNEIEPVKNYWTFAALDWQVEQAQKRNVGLTLVLGRRTPHWPECHDPVWLKDLPEELVVERQLIMMQKVIERYKNYDNIKIWQVENEPLLNVFGVCPPGDINLLRKEVSFVKTLDDRPVLTTDSGELGLWMVASSASDLFGTTMYRVTYNENVGYFYYHLPPAFYRFKAWLVGLDPDKVFVSELQAEPWAPQGLLSTSLEEQKKSMDAERLINHVKYAERTGFSGAYLWGAEWWYWLDEVKNDPSLWDTAKIMFE